jgi:small subunit ribosomal protein S18
MASEVSEEVRGERSGAAGGDRGDRGDRGDKKRSVGRRKMCKFCADEAIKIDYKDAGLLKYFITDRGKLVPRRLSGNCAKHQREISTAVNRARMIALMPFSVTGA